MSFGQGTNTSNNPKYYNSGTNARVYKNNTFSVEGPKIIKVIVNYTKNYPGVLESTPEGLTANADELNWTWTGEADKIDFVNVSNSSNLQLRIESIQVIHKQTDPVDLMEITPAEGEVEELYNFEITFGDYTATCKEDAEVLLTKEGDETQVNGMLEMSADNKTVNVGLEYNVTESGTYTLTIPASAITVDGKAMPALTFNYTIKEAEPEPQGDQLVELPAGVEGEVWHADGTFWQWNGSRWADYEVNDDNFEFQVAFDGNDVYISGFDIYAPTAWVKGTLEGTVLTIPAGQFTDESIEDGTTYKEYIIGLSTDSENVVDIVFNYNEAEQMFVLSSEVGGVGIAPDPSETAIYGYYEPLRIFKEIVVDELVTLPAGVEVDEYIYDGVDITFDSDRNPVETPFSTTVKVAFDGDDVYINGISKDINTDTWIKGMRDGATVTFPYGQWLGGFQFNSTDYNIYVLGYNAAISDITMTYDEEEDKFTANEMVIINTSKSALSYFYIYDNVVIYKMSEPEPDGINELSSDDANAMFYDMQGRRTNSNARGLLIKQTIDAKGAVKNVKVVK